MRKGAEEKKRLLRNEPSIEEYHVYFPNDFEPP
jgi:hypothetical protein